MAFVSQISNRTVLQRKQNAHQIAASISFMPKTTMEQEQKTTQQHGSQKDDNEWEDIDSEEDEVRSKYEVGDGGDRTLTTPPGRITSVARSVRKRKGPGRINTTPSSPRKPNQTRGTSNKAKLPLPPLPPPPPITLQQGPEEPFVKEELKDAFFEGCWAIVIYFYDIFITFFKFIKKPLSLVLALWFLAIMLARISELVTKTLSPVCKFPFISRMTICVIEHVPVDKQDIEIKEPVRAAFPSMMDMQNKAFEQILDNPISDSGLSMEVNKAQLATSDLIVLVSSSQLVCKDLLAEALREFVNDARSAARDLQRLNAKVGGSIDSITAVNDYALKTLEGASEKRMSIKDVVWPFSSSRRDPAVLLITFQESMTVLSRSLTELINVSFSSINALDRLEAQLKNIHEIVTRENITVSKQHNQLLAELWTILGGNRKELSEFKDTLELLKNIAAYRNHALAHVTSALHALQTLNADMEELRDRVSSPALAGGRIPLEVHVKSIRNGIDRLSEGRRRVKKRQLAVDRKLGLGSE